MGFNTISYLRLALLFVGISHLHGKGENLYALKFIYQLYAVFFGAFVNIPQIYFVVYNIDDRDLFFQGIIFTGVNQILFAKLVCHMVYRDKLKDIIERFVIEDFESTIEFVSNLRKRETIGPKALKLEEFLKKSKLSVIRTTNYLVAADSIPGMTCVTLFSIAPIILGLVYPEDYFRELPMTMRFPYDEKKTPNYQITFLIHVYFAYFLGFGFNGPDSLYIVTIGHMVRQFWVVGYLMENMHELVGELTDQFTEEWEKECNKLLVDCTKHFVKLKRYCEQLNSVLQPFLLLQAVYSSALLSISMYIIATSEKIFSTANMRYVSFQVAGIIQLFIYSAGGQKIRDASEELSAQVEGGCEWWLHSRRFRSSLRTFAAYVDRPITMTIWGSIELSYATFGAMVKTTMSYFTMLLAVTEQGD